jgi:dihydrofolate reductase
VGSLEQAFEICKDKHDEVFVLGGSEIYQLALPRVDRLYLTWVDQDFEGDAFFPEFSMEDFKEVSREDRNEGIPYRFLVLDRNPL